MAGLTRRDALELMGSDALAMAIDPLSARGETPTYPQGAIIRTLFHEHLLLGEDFNARFRAAGTGLHAPCRAHGAGAARCTA